MSTAHGNDRSRTPAGGVDGSAEVDGSAQVDGEVQVGGGAQVTQVTGVAVTRGDAGAAPGDAGMATAEYAVATLAAVGFAGLLFAVLRSGEVQEMLLDLVRRALSTV